MNAALRLEDSQRPHLAEVWCKEKQSVAFFFFWRGFVSVWPSSPNVELKLKWPICVCVFNCSTLQNKYVKKHYFYHIIGGFSSQICSQHADKTEQMPQQSGAPCSLSKQARSVNMGIERKLAALHGASVCCVSTVWYEEGRKQSWQPVRSAATPENVTIHEEEIVKMPVLSLSTGQLKVTLVTTRSAE